MRFSIKCVLISAFIFTVLTAQAQRQVHLNFEPNPQFGYSGEVVDAARRSNGDYVLIGNFSDQTNGVSGPFIVRIDSNLNVVWKKRFWCTSAGELFLPLQVGINNKTSGFYVVCEEQYNATITPISYVWLIEFDTLGNLQWQKRFDNGFSQANGHVVQLSDGRFMLLYNPGIGDGLVYTDSAGAVQQQVSFNLTQSQNFFTAIILPDNQGGYFSVGYVGTAMSVMRADASGQPLWRRTYSKPGVNCLSSDACIASDGGLLCCGQFNSLNGMMYPFLMKLDSSGNFLWYRNWQDTTTVYGTRFTKIATGANGTIATIGYRYINSSSYPTILSRFDSSGNLLGSHSLNDTLQNWHYHVNQLHAISDGRMFMPGTGPAQGLTTTSILLETDTASWIGCVETAYPLQPLANPSLQLSNEAIPQPQSFPVSITTGPFTVNAIPYLQVNNGCYNAMGLEESSEAGALSVYPNPATDQVIVSWPLSPDAVRFFLRDISGRIVCEKQLPASGKGMETIGLRELSSGIYFVEITAGRNTWRSKLVKQ